MKILKNKLFLIGIAAIILLLWVQIYQAYSQSTRDVRTYLSPLSPEVFLNDMQLSESSRHALGTGDTIQTWVTGRAVIEWGDGSVTRVGEWSELRIEEADVSPDRSRINISFELFSGKTWSQVISFLGTDSSFSQKFEWFDAGVRGTVFDVNLDTGFIHTTQHAVELRDPEGQSYLITPEKPFDISKKLFIDLDVFLRAFQDTLWTEFNTTADQEYQVFLLKNINIWSLSMNPFTPLMEWIFPSHKVLSALEQAESFDEIEVLIEKLSDSSRQKTFKKVLARYQDYNFVTADQEVLHTRKLFYQKALVLLSDDSQFQASMFERSLLDVEGLLEAGKTEKIQELLEFMQGYPNLLEQIDTTILKRWLESIPEGLRAELQKSIEGISNLFRISLSDISNPQDILDTAWGAVENFLEESFWDTIRNFLE